jgi:hypothetical protein
MQVPSPGRLWMSIAAAQRLDAALDDVHADAAAGQVGHLLGGREARLEDELVDLPSDSDWRSCDQPLLDRLLQDALAVEAAAVVAHLDDDAARLVARR